MISWGMYGYDSGGADFQGTITTTFTWRPDNAGDLPPTAVVIAEQGQTAMQCSSTSNATPTTNTLDNDLGFPFVSTSRSSSGNSFTDINAASSGTRYKIKENPGQSFTITCSPNISIQGTGSINPEAHGSGGASLTYQATATPLGVVLSGGIGTKNNRSFLIGQQVTGTVSTGGLTANGFNWTASGNPFKNWQVSFTSPSDSTAASLVPFGTQTQPSVTFYYSQPAPQSTVATSVHLVVPPGALPAAGLDTTLSKTCVVDPPTWTIGETTGTTRLKPASSPWYVAFDGASHTYSTGLSLTAGIVWYGTVTTPAAYGSGGGWNVTQLGKLHRVRSEDGTLQGLACNDFLALDGSFGYDPVYPGLYSDTGSQQGSGDSPQDWFFSSTESLTINDNFTDYLMYRPPGAGSCFVPLENFTWFWKGQVLPDTSGGWRLFNAGGSSATGSQYPSHPIWSGDTGQGLNYVNLPGGP